ncbi:response regulator [Pontibacter diazotrophicus]|uniref:Response regulator n=1 Tax=Pontibacter diazotrophicus TaxID=1400979 RepID=A0A3D8L389_9BACT|nr:response regulator [Pontibacter diazotrophicus]RDV11452.1 response regulator [Pontibacter diazotrophicus]
MEYIRRVLIIDDDATSVFLTKRVVSNMCAGAEIQTAQSGSEGMKLLVEAKKKRLLPQLILLDINMHDMSGLTLLEELGKLRVVNLIDTQIVLLTSSVDPLHIASAKRHMAATYLPKPLTKQSLLDILA